MIPPRRPPALSLLPSPADKEAPVIRARSDTLMPSLDIPIKGQCIMYRL